MSAEASDLLGMSQLRDERATDTMLRVVSVSHAFARAEHAVLDDVSLEVPEGAFVTLLGPSGCGKTTLLRIVAGLLSASANAEIYVDGVRSTGPSRDKAVVFQHFHLFPWRTALANIAYGLELHGVGKRERLTRAREYLELVGLTGYDGHYPAELSGGMQQRVGIARALVVEPKILLMDEPFGALDALTREQMQTELQKICAQTNATVLFVTHSIDEALYMSDRVLVMGTRPGRIVAEFGVTFPRPRWNYAVRADPEFGQLRDRLWGELERELAAGAAHERPDAHE